MKRWIWLLAMPVVMQEQNPYIVLASSSPKYSSVLAERVDGQNRIVRWCLTKEECYAMEEAFNREHNKELHREYAGSDSPRGHL
jgi:hypothetical protein